MTAPKKVRGIGWRHHDDTDDDLDELHAEVERAASAERARIVAPLTERSEADEMGEAWWQNHVRRLTAKHARQIDHNESFYAVRIQAISDLAKQHGIWGEVAAILANGKVSPQDPPTYDHMLAREKARADKAEANYRWMVERAADQRLDGYRELGAKCAALEAERDAAAEAERERIVALLAERAETTRDWDGRETVVSLTYCQAADLARGGPRDP